jgi:hypothetical protein
MYDAGEEWESVMRDYTSPRLRSSTPHIGHKYHLCDMAESGAVTLADMKALVKDPKFICKKCGRAAANAVNLCEPEPLDLSCPACGMSFPTQADLMEHAKEHKK